MEVRCRVGASPFDRWAHRSTAGQILVIISLHGGTRMHTADSPRHHQCLITKMLRTAGSRRQTSQTKEHDVHHHRDMLYLYAH
eukprot:17253-Heterococcus_DN1.PRE.2